MPWAGRVTGIDQLEFMNEYHRLANHVDSWIALGIVVYAVLLAATLNHRVSHVRTVGTLLAALGCFAAVGWFAWVVQTGYLVEPRGSEIGVDPNKPVVMWLMFCCAFAAGVLLLWSACCQTRQSTRLDLPLTNSASRFGRISRYLHWVTAVLFLAMIPLGLFASTIPYEAEWRQGYYVVHKTLGLTVLALVLVRLVWHLRTPAPPLEASLKPWERRLARLGHILLYLLMLALPVSGYVVSTYAGRYSHFFVWDVPLLWDRDPSVVRPYGIVHKFVLPYLCYAVVGAHVAGVLKHHFIDRHRKNIRRMVS